MILENFDTKFVRICDDFLGKLVLKFFFVAKVFSLLTIQFEANRRRKWAGLERSSRRPSLSQISSKGATNKTTMLEQFCVPADKKQFILRVFLTLCDVLFVVHSVA